MSRTPEIGDYVLATKYHDGDPCDQFCVGFISSIDRDRFIIVDNEGNSFRRNGFRKAEKITEEEGRQLVEMFSEIGDVSGPSLWWRLEKIREGNVMRTRWTRDISRYEAFLVWLACVAGMWAIIGWCWLASELGLW